MALSASSPVHRAPGVLWRDGAFGVVILAPGSPEPQTLTGTGRSLWQALAEPVTPSELARALAAEYGAQPERVAADIIPVLEQLCAVGAVEVSR